MSACLVCGSGSIERLLDLGRQPVSSHFATSPEEAVVEHNLTLAFCNACATVQLAKPFPLRDLLPRHDWITYREPEAHLDAVVEKICALPGLDKEASIAGISFKDRTTLDRLRRRGFAQARLLDLRADAGSAEQDADVASVQAQLTPRRVEEIVGQHGSFDLVIARHVVEHAEVPSGFLQALSRLLSPKGYLVVEVPNCGANIARQDYAMIWEEHVLYLTGATAPQILASAGCAEVSIDNYPLPFEDVLVVTGRKSEAAERKARPIAEATRERELARRFAAAFGTWTDRIRSALDQLTRDGRRLACYGAGHLSCAFINFHDVANYFAFVVDDTPRKQGLFLPKNKLPIVPRERLNAREVSACLLGLSPHLEDQVIANNATFVRAGGRFYSMFADSGRSIRSLMPTGS